MARHGVLRDLDHRAGGDAGDRVAPRDPRGHAGGAVRGGALRGDHGRGDLRHLSQRHAAVQERAPREHLQRLRPPGVGAPGRLRVQHAGVPGGGKHQSPRGGTERLDQRRLGVSADSDQPGLRRHLGRRSDAVPSHRFRASRHVADAVPLEAGRLRSAGSRVRDARGAGAAHHANASRQPEVRSLEGRPGHHDSCRPDHHHAGCLLQHLHRDRRRDSRVQVSSIRAGAVGQPAGRRVH
mmetsp:Transcript_6572/g.25388  ORF Transcript_6572/g.25388 Transcript_6572/m.25388 type:complete len:238 (+) Transcript_6572:211-924(+)